MLAPVAFVSTSLSLLCNRLLAFERRCMLIESALFRRFFVLHIIVHSSLSVPPRISMLLPCAGCFVLDTDFSNLLLDLRLEVSLGIFDSLSRPAQVNLYARHISDWEDRAQ